MGKMKTYRIVLSRVEYYAKEYIIEASNEEDAIDRAWDMSGNWQRVDSAELTESCTEEKTETQKFMEEHFQLIKIGL